VWGEGVVQRYSGIDMSQSMLDAAKIMTTSMGQPLPNDHDRATGGSNKRAAPVVRGGRVDVTLSHKSLDVMSRIAAGGDQADEHRFDMAVCSYTLAELTSDSVKRAAMQVLYESLDVNGVLVIIDNGSPIGSHNTRSARKMLLDLFGR
jgi:ribosomal protein RSM22 (predicted rRNA methylase)